MKKIIIFGIIALLLVSIATAGVISLSNKEISLNEKETLKVIKDIELAKPVQPYEYKTNVTCRFINLDSNETRCLTTFNYTINNEVFFGRVRVYEGDSTELINNYTKRYIRKATARYYNNINLEYQAQELVPTKEIVIINK
jgi:hypothetical protein